MHPDALASCVARSSAAMELPVNIYIDEWLLSNELFHICSSFEEGGSFVLCWNGSFDKMDFELKFKFYDIFLCTE